MDPLSFDSAFNLLSLPDLIQARDHYHVHLMHKENVVATAIGRYRIRRSDPWPSAHAPEVNKPQKGKSVAPKEKRTLENSEVRPYSWPCILVFVKQWVEPGNFGKTSHGAQIDDVIPSSLYMPDGRVVPVCVVEAPTDEHDLGPVTNPNFPSNLLGGGYPVLADVQGDEHLASVGCLVSDGHLIYALTNRHVAGAAGEPIYSLLATKKVEIGRSSGKQLTRLPFEQVYADWPGKNVYVNLDVGLIEVADKSQWTAQIYGVGAIGKLADLSLENLSLKLIGCPVRAYGCASGEMKGEIQGLFYRYKSVGGFEYIADFLIGARKDCEFNTHPGDSGTVWLLDPPTPLSEPTDNGKKGKKPDKQLPMPIALQWGGHVFGDSQSSSHLRYALATCLSTVCNLLEVDVVRDWNLGQDDYWGAVGHYSIANKAIDFIRNSRLQQLLKANLTNITLNEENINKRGTSGLSKKAFVPLADVPDLVWKLGHYNRGNPEHPNHFADMDKPGPDHRTLLDICRDQPDNVRVEVWQKYYHDVGDKSMGLLPFRVWQFYQSMVQFVRDGEVDRFVCAAGILSHYVGDACQPLHISYLFNGDPDHLESAQQRDRKTHEMVTVNLPRGTGVHAAYEDGMVDRHSAEILNGIEAQAKSGTAVPLVQGGHSAAVAVVSLMQQTFDTIQPRDIVDTYVRENDSSPKQVADALWDEFGKKTIHVMVLGCRYLAMLWDSAWKEGGGDDTVKDLGEIQQDALEALYQDRKFLPSHTLDTIGPILMAGAGESNGTETGPTTHRGRAGHRKTESTRHSKR
jgi:hypothetical protein